MSKHASDDLDTTAAVKSSGRLTNQEYNPIGRKKMSQRKFKKITRQEVESWHAEEGAKELFESPAMKPYVKTLTALISGTDPTVAMEELAALPLEKRYTWRIASALKWAFADFDS